jgi:molybdopterin-guanine dinucleotide biosynthesis protein A
LLDGVLAATAGAARTVVVGPPRPVDREVRWAREDPPGGGPLAALAAGVRALWSADGEELPTGDGSPHPAAAQGSAAPVVAVLAADLPWLTPRDVRRLLDSLDAAVAADAAVFVDGEGRRQVLAGAYRGEELRRILGELGAVRPPAGVPARLLLERCARVIEVPDGGASRDCDTPEQLAAARAALELRTDPHLPDPRATPASTPAVGRKKQGDHGIG